MRIFFFFAQMTLNQLLDYPYEHVFFFKVLVPFEIQFQNLLEMCRLGVEKFS